MRLQERRVVVTGGGRGIGAATARLLAHEGANVVVAARTKSEIDGVAREIGGRAVLCDVSREEEVRRLAEEAGEADILVNNAGIAPSGPVKSIPLEEWNRVLAVNVTSVFLCTRAFLPGMMRRKWGRIVNVASVAGLVGGAYMAAYAASKHAVLGFTRCAALEAAPHGVTVNAICPAYVDTDMTRVTVERIAQKTGRSLEEALDMVRSTNPGGKLITPEEVAEKVLFCCTQDMNGEALVLPEGGL